MFCASSMLCSRTFTLTTLSSDVPAASRMSFRFSRICRVSVAVVPRSKAVSPDTNTKTPPRTASDPAITSRGGNDIELDLETGFDLRAPHGAGGRPARDVLPVHAVQHVVLDAVVDQRVHLHQPLERRARRRSEERRVGKECRSRWSPDH